MKPIKVGGIIMSSLAMTKSAQNIDCDGYQQVLDEVDQATNDAVSARKEYVCSITAKLFNKDFTACKETAANDHLMKRARVEDEYEDAAEEKADYDEFLAGVDANTTAANEILNAECGVDARFAFDPQDGQLLWDGMRYEEFVAKQEELLSELAKYHFLIEWNDPDWADFSGGDPQPTQEECQAVSGDVYEEFQELVSTSCCGEGAKINPAVIKSNGKGKGPKKVCKKGSKGKGPKGKGPKGKGPKGKGKRKGPKH